MQNLKINEEVCGTCPIRKRAVCAHCDSDEQLVLDDMKYYRTYEAGQTLVWAGDKMEFVGSVVSGVASLSQTMEDGRTQMVGLLLPSDFVGRPGQEFAPYDVVAATDVMMCCFHKGAFEKMMKETPHIAQRLLEMTLNELDAAREWMVLLGRKTAREKIASLIAIFARRDAKLMLHNADKPFEFDLPITREAMANYLGLTLETVSRQVSALKKEGIIELQGKRHVTIPDFKVLMAQTGDDDGAGLLT